MALLFKKPTNDNKGIIILTHKENAVAPLLFKYRKDYLIGMHVGWDLKDNTARVLKSNPDFIMSSLTQLADDFPKKDIVIEMNSRNFLPEHFCLENKNKENLLASINEMYKYSKPKLSESIMNKIKITNDNDTIWDILWVNRPHMCKEPIHFLNNLKKLFDTYGRYETLMVCPIAKSGEFVDIPKKINEIFSEEDKKFISVLVPFTKGPMGIDNTFVSPFYHWSKVFAFYSSVEGESRVVHEALCGGCPVVYYSGVKGGSNDYLDNNNSYSFDNYDDSYLKLYESVTNTKKVDLQHIYNICIDRYTLDKFKEKLEKIYQMNGQKFDRQLEKVTSLNVELPAHNNNVPWYDPSNVTADLTPNKFSIFEKQLII
jgi:hypothetical protein